MSRYSLNCARISIIQANFYKIQANSIFYHTLDMSLRLADVIGDSSVVSTYTSAMSGIKSAVNLHLWDLLKGFSLTMTSTKQHKPYTHKMEIPGQLFPASQIPTAPQPSAPPWRLAGYDHKEHQLPRPAQPSPPLHRVSRSKHTSCPASPTVQLT